MCQAQQVTPVYHTDPNPPSTTASTASSQVNHKPFQARVLLDPDGCLDEDTGDKFIAATWNLMNVLTPPYPDARVQVTKLNLQIQHLPTLPPQCNGRLPQCNRNTIKDLQNKFEKLQGAGVFGKPEQVNILPGYLNTRYETKCLFSR